MIKKTELLKAMKRILQEYKKNDHVAHLDNCALCGLFNQNSDRFTGNKDEIQRSHECKLCPMFAFKVPHMGRYDYPCMKRRCEPIGL